MAIKFLEIVRIRHAIHGHTAVLLHVVVALPADGTADGKTLERALVETIAPVDIQLVGARAKGLRLIAARHIEKVVDFTRDRFFGRAGEAVQHDGGHTGIVDRLEEGVERGHKRIALLGKILATTV